MSSSTMRLDRRPNKPSGLAVTALGTVIILACLVLAMVASAYLTPSASRAREARDDRDRAYALLDSMNPRQYEAERTRIFREERLREEYHRNR